MWYIAMQTKVWLGHKRDDMSWIPHSKKTYADKAEAEKRKTDLEEMFGKDYNFKVVETPNN